jgi:hypothetical protein
LTFLIDPPLLIFFGFITYSIGELCVNRTRLPVSQILAVFSVCTIIFTSSTLYLNLWFMNWFWQPFYPVVSSGRDLMINSGIFNFESENTTGLIDTLAFIQIALYPLWTYIGVKLYHWYKNKK